jgi:hypothetical protein
MKIHLTKDFLSGLLFTAIGLGVVVWSQNYKLGTLSNMGPGYYQIILGAIMALIVAAIMVRSARSPETSEVVASWEIRPMIFVMAAILAFSMLIETSGLIVAVAALVLVSRLAGREGSLPELGLMAVVITAVAVAIFIYGLNVPLKLRPW